MPDTTALHSIATPAPLQALYDAAIFIGPQFELSPMPDEDID
ncbi:hypothetical protein [Comamonas suwonensis]|nr:hypothetical protein [Comamonas suwonensis]